MPSAGRFAPRWIVEEQNACLVVKDVTGHALGYFYFEDEPGRRPSCSPGARPRRMAANFGSFWSCCCGP